MRTRLTFRHLLALTIIGSIGLSACGIRGELKTPPPLWGDQGDKQAEKPESNS